MTAARLVMAGVAAALAAWWMWPSDRAMVRATLDRLAKTVSVPSSEEPLAVVGRVAALRELLAPDVRVALDGAALSLDDRDAALGAASSLGRALAPLEVSIVGADIVLEGVTAHARVTVKVSTGDRRAARYDGEELLIDLVKSDSQWVVSRVTLDRALTKPVAGLH